jgi:thymidylate synthase
MNNLDKQYQILLKTILEFGVDKKDRTGTGTKSIFGYTIRHNMKDGFPLLTTKKMPFKTIVTELLWFLRGDTNIKYLVDNDCHIWDGDAYKRYVDSDEVRWPKSKEDFIEHIKTDDEFAKTWGDLGPIYGKQWRWWGYEPQTEERGYGIKGIDQIANLINDLKTNPDSRRLMVNAWNVGELDSMVLPPCHYGFQVYTRELSLEERVSILGDIQTNDNGYYEHSYAKLKCDEHNVPKRAISLMWNQRSVDTFLGLPFNIASYGLLLEIIAKAVNMVPDELIGNLGDTHLYLNHIEQAKEQIGRDYTIDEMLNFWVDGKEPGKSIRDYVDSLDYWLKIEYLKAVGIPKHTKEPYPLPTLKHMKTDDFYKSLSEDVSLFTHLDITDFVVDGYQSHPTIKAPLSN